MAMGERDRREIDASPEKLTSPGPGRAPEELEPKLSGLVVAIDGPSGVGKSTLARALADALGLPYVNTGAMYRAVTAAAISRGVSIEDGEALGKLARSFDFALRPMHEGSPAELTIDGVGESAALRSEEVERAVSAVSRHPEVRRVLRASQRILGAGGCVMEGRDIGSVVFPDAKVKILLTAREGIRAERRALERTDRPADAVAEAVARRDALDSLTTPLEAGPGTHVLDTTGMGAQEVLAEALRIVTAQAPQRLPSR